MIYEERKQLFKKYYHWSLKTNDCDPAIFMMKYVNERMELNTEQRYWFAWLYGNTYNVATAWILFNEFPDFENVDYQRLSNWNENNYRHLRYQVDNKWQKGYLHTMYDSYQSNIHSVASSQQEFFDNLTTSDNEYDNFDTCNKFIIKNFYKFGRYLSWFYLQTLHETCGVKVQPKNLLLRDSASESHRNGLIYALGLDEVLEDETYKFTPEMYEFLDEQAALLLTEMQSEYKDVVTDYFTMETTLCAFKKVFRTKHGRYLGYYIDRQAEDIKQCEKDNWSGIDWDLLWDARSEMLDKRLLSNKVNPSRMGEYGRTGTIENIDWY